MSSEKTITTSLASTASGAASISFDDMQALLEQGQKQIDDLNDQLVESLLVGGFRVIINEDLPRGMVAVLPGNFKGSLRRVMDKLKAGSPPPDYMFIRNVA